MLKNAEKGKRKQMAQPSYSTSKGNILEYMEASKP